jgi:hypothetical protein
MIRKRKLKVWNGMVFIGRKQVPASFCAYSQKDAVALLNETGLAYTTGEIRNYWSPCWGNSMDGIERERGLWIEMERDKPERFVRA